MICRAMSTRPVRSVQNQIDKHRRPKRREPPHVEVESRIAALQKRLAEHIAKFHGNKRKLYHLAGDQILPEWNLSLFDESDRRPLGEANLR